MSHLRQLVAVAGLLGFAAQPVYAEDCGFLGNQSYLQDRQVYYEVTPNGPWELLTQPRDSFSERPVKLAYVFRETFSEGHSGVLIIKAGRNRQSNEPVRSSRDKKIVLFRDRGSYCKGGKSPINVDVTARSYDDYHDRGLGDSESSTIDSFHVGYRGRKPYCRQTNERRTDTADPRSNRGQFSYNSQVLLGGTYSQVAGWWSSSAYAEPYERYEDRRVEIKQYETLPQQPTCVRITLPTQKPGGFVRINDLEGLEFYQRDYIRSFEKEWNLTLQ
ncbi:hypothetical protein [Nitrobacter sp. JJSN]|uniref:hypothetical protein n=1 Tax=Nitrobacter sp. JJSN TaxID=3453033 RepID=UPI003F7610D9